MSRQWKQNAYREENCNAEMPKAKPRKHQKKRIYEFRDKLLKRYTGRKEFWIQYCVLKYFIIVDVRRVLQMFEGKIKKVDNSV